MNWDHRVSKNMAERPSRPARVALWSCFSVGSILLIFSAFLGVYNNNVTRRLDTTRIQAEEGITNPLTWGFGKAMPGGLSGQENVDLLYGVRA